MRPPLVEISSSVEADDDKDSKQDESSDLYGSKKGQQSESDSDDGDAPEEPKNAESIEYRDIVNFIQDWVCAEGIRLFENDEKVALRLENDKFLSVLFKFILSPFKILPNSRAKKRFNKFESIRLEIYDKKTTLGNAKVIYIPEKHNIYYLRAEKTMLLFFLRSNYKTLLKRNPRHVDVFYRTVAEEVLNNDKARLDMLHLVQMMQYFLLHNVGDSLRGIIRHHVVYELLGNIEIPAARETLISLLTPGDNFLKVEDKDRVHWYAYLEAVKFHRLFSAALESHKVLDILLERARVQKDEGVQEAVEALAAKFRPPESKSKNFLLSFFHSLFNKELITKHHKQPEDIYTKILNIDRLPQPGRTKRGSTVNLEEPSKGLGGKGPSRLVKMSTIGNLDSLYDVYEVDELAIQDNHEGFKPDLYLLKTPPKPKPLASKPQPELMDLNTPSYHDTKLRSKNYSFAKIASASKFANQPGSQRKNTRRLRVAARCVMCTNLLLGRPQKKTKLKMQRLAKYKNYPEHILNSHPDIKRIKVDARKYFERCQREERNNQRMMEIMYGMINSALTQKTFGSFNQMIRLTPGNIQLMNKVFFRSEALIITLLKVFLLRMPYHLEDKTLMASAYLAGKTFLLLLKNM